MTDGDFYSEKSSDLTLGILFQMGVDKEWKCNHSLSYLAVLDLYLEATTVFSRQKSSTFQNRDCIATQVMAVY